MSLRVVFPNSFTRKANRLARKHPSLTVELRALHVELSRGQKPGDRLQGAGAEVYKVRLANRSVQSGERRFSCRLPCWRREDNLAGCLSKAQMRCD